MSKKRHFHSSRQTAETLTKATLLSVGGLGLALLTACGGGGGGGGSSSDTGTASFAVTDGPVDDVDGIHLTFSRIDIKPKEGPAEEFIFDEPLIIENLLALTGNASQVVVSDREVPAGEYQWIRIYVEGGFPNSYVVPSSGGPEEDLFIPGQQNGNSNGNPRFLQLNSGFIVPAGGEADFTLDFVLRKGLTKPANGDGYYLLRPAMRLINNVEVGTIVGTVDATVLASTRCAASEGNTVYLYEGDITAAEQAPDDVYDPGIEGGSDEVMEAEGARPVTTAEVVQDNDGAMSFEIGFVREIEAGYSLAFTCESSNDFAATDDDITFTEVVYTQVEAGQTATVTFTELPPEPVQDTTDDEGSAEEEQTLL